MCRRDIISYFLYTILCSFTTLLDIHLCCYVTEYRASLRTLADLAYCKVLVLYADDHRPPGRSLSLLVHNRTQTTFFTATNVLRIPVTNLPATFPTYTQLAQAPLNLNSLQDSRDAPHIHICIQTVTYPGTDTKLFAATVVIMSDNYPTKSTAMSSKANTHYTA